jgi:hypothetical protein
VSPHHLLNRPQGGIRRHNITRLALFGPIVYVGQMLDTARKAVSMTRGISRETHDTDENLRLALIHLVQTIGEAARHDVHARHDVQ